jgi:SagB-type dehydrogenase family enzyme
VAVAGIESETQNTFHMKTLMLIIISLSVSAILAAQEIKLPEPQRTGGMPLLDALNNRQSTREFSEREIDLQILSNLLWAGWGFNRETGKRTAPSSQNLQEIDIYVVKADGFYLYDAKNQSIIKLGDDDLRSTTGTQDFVSSAPLNLVYVADLDKAKAKNFEDQPTASYANTGFIAQNIYLYCASKGLGAVVRGSFPNELSDKLKLREHQRIILAQTIGWPKE